MKRINFILYDFPRTPNGGNKVVYEYAEYLGEQGYDVVIYYRWAYNHFHLPLFVRKLLINIVVQYFPHWFTFNKNVKRKNVYDINDENIREADVIVATDIRTAYPVAGLNKNKGKKFYLIQGFENWDFSDEYVYSTYSLGMTNITVARWLKRIVDKYSKSPAICISNSINTNVFKYENISHNLHTLSFHYREAAYKGCDDAIEVIKKLKNIYPDLHVYVISREDCPDNMPRFVEFIKNASPSDVARIDNLSSVFLCTSVVEGFGLPGLEAMACGSVLVSTNYDGVLEYAVDQENALLSDVHDVDDLVKNIRLVFDNKDLRDRLKENGIKTAKERALKISCEKFEKVILGEE